MKIVDVNPWSPSKPHATQLEVLNDPSRFKLLRCGRKWRKTSLGVSWLMEQAIADTEERTYPFILPYESQARESVWNDHVRRILRGFDLAGFPYKVNEQVMSVKFPKHGRLKLYGADNDAALRSISSWGAAVGDEYDDWKPHVWHEIIRPNLMVYRAPAILMGTPRGKGNIYKFEQEGIFKTFHFTSYDNPDLPREELDALIEEYKAKGEDYYLQEIMAEYRKPAGAIYPEFNIDTHVVDPFLIPAHWQRYRSIDLGELNPTACAWVAVDPDGKWYVYDEYYESNRPTEDHAEVMLLKTGKDRIRGSVLDENGLGKQLLLDYNKYGLHAVGQRHHSVTDGIARVREKIVLNKYTGKPSLFVFRGCDTIISEFENYRWDDRGSSDVDPKESPLKKDDHLMDCLRNLAMTFFYARTPDEDEWERRMRQRRTRVPKVSALTGY